MTTEGGLPEHEDTTEQLKLPFLAIQWVNVPPSGNN